MTFTRSAAALISTLFLAAAAHADVSVDEAAVRSLVAEQAAAWNAGDAKRYGRAFAADGAFTNVFGMVMYGAPAFEARHREILGSFFRGTSKTHTIRRIRFVTPDVAIVDIDNELRGVRSLPAGIPVPADGILRTQLMQVLVRRDGRWWVEAYHNVDVKSARPPR